VIENLFGQFASFFLRGDLFENRIFGDLLLNQFRQFQRRHLQHLDALAQLWRENQTLRETGSKPD
jgi:hypothetical protein